MNQAPELCPCGQPLHYPNADTDFLMRRLVAKHGPDVKVVTSAGAWMVPRHYVALHGLDAEDVPALAEKYHWPVAGHGSGPCGSFHECAPD